MPHVDFDVLREELDRIHAAEEGSDDGLSFTLFGRRYLCRPAPMIGDSFDLMDAPEPLDNEPRAHRALAKFIRRMITSDEDKAAWDEALYRLGPQHLPILEGIAAELVEQYAHRPSSPPAGSSVGRPGTGPSANEQPEPTAGVPVSTP